MEKETKKPLQEEKKQTKSKESFTGIGNGSSLRSRTGSWFECKVRYERTMEDGTKKSVTELYIVDALSFTEAEAKIIDEMSCYVSGEFKVVSIVRASFNEIFFSDITEDELWFKAKLAFLTINEKTEKEKRTYQNYLVQGKCIERAKRYVDEVMGHTMIDYELKSLSESKILDVFEHHDKENSTSEKQKQDK